MHNSQNLREELIREYPKSDSWRDRVKKMSDAQVLAILMRIRNNKRGSKK